MKTALNFNDKTSHSADTGVEPVKDPLSSANFITVIEHLHEVMQALRGLYPDRDWHIKWQKLTRR